MLSESFPGYFEVKNFGHTGATMMKTGNNSYWNSAQFLKSLESDPDYVIILLGNNDSRHRFWNETQFVNDYIEMINLYRSLKVSTKVYMMLCTPLYIDGVYAMN